LVVTLNKGKAMRNSIFTNELPLTNIERLDQYGKKVLISADFMQGQIDFHNGLKQRACNSESYDRGYSAQYDLEQRNTAMIEIRESRKWK
jgi:hypothetical protein